MSAGVPPRYAILSDMPVRAAQQVMTAAFAEAGIETADADARVLLQGVLNIDGLDLIRSPELIIGDAAAQLNAAIKRRLAHEPVSRILGRRGFYGRTFRVTPDVLDPRPDTEAVVDLALEIIRSDGLDRRPITIADIGTGSGILIATLLAELPLARGTATDVSPAALALAEANAQALGVADRVQFLKTSVLQGCPGPFDLIVSNPPYIPSGDIAGLDAEVRAFDPVLALDGGSDGLDIYRILASEISELSARSFVVVEIGIGQEPDVHRIFSSAGASYIATRPDLGGILRAVAFEIHP